MFITLTALNYTSGSEKFTDRTINFDEVASFAPCRLGGGAPVAQTGTKITWRDRDRPLTVVTATADQIAATLSATNLTSRKDHR